jgi:hypothetical protein
MRTSRVSLLIAAAAFTASATAAHAESRAWTAAKKTLPANMQVVAGISFGQIRSSQLFQTMWPTLMAQAGDAKTTLDTVKTSCGIDVVNQLDSIVFAVDEAQQGGAVIALKGTTQKDLDACFQKFAKEKGKTATISKDGALTKYAGGDKALYVKWLGKDVFAVSSKPDDKDATAKFVAGGLTADKSMKAPLAASKTDAAFWGVVNKGQDLTDLGAKMLMGYGSADVKSGNIAADLHLVLDSAKAAADSAVKATEQINQAKKSGQIPPMFASMLSSLKITAAGSEIVVSASVAEKDLMGLVSMLGAAAGGAKTP